MTMNILNNKNKRISIFKTLALCLFAAVSLTLVSCDDDMDIQQSYPFTVETMPVPNKVTKGQTVEIRCELKKTGDFANTLYTIRYFQFEGEGTLKMDNGITFLPNDRYLLENEKFRLYYTAAGEAAGGSTARCACFQTIWEKGGVRGGDAVLWCCICSHVCAEITEYVAVSVARGNRISRAWLF